MCEHLGQCRREMPFSRQGRASSALPPKWGTSQGPHLFWSTQICSLHHTKMIFLKDKSYTTDHFPSRFSVSCWLCGLQVPGRANEFLVLAGLFPAVFLATFFLHGRAAAAPAFFQSFGVSCFPAPGSLHLLSPLPHFLLLPRSAFS